MMDLITYLYIVATVLVVDLLVDLDFPAYVSMIAKKIFRSISSWIVGDNSDDAADIEAAFDDCKKDWNIEDKIYNLGLKQCAKFYGMFIITRKFVYTTFICIHKQLNIYLYARIHHI